MKELIKIIIKCKINRVLFISKFIKNIILFLLLITLAYPAYSDTKTFKTGEKLYIEKKYNEAKKHFKTLVEYGHSNAETMTGIMFLKGQGYKLNASIAAIWFYKASLKGNNNAQLILGTQYLYGYGVKKDLKKAYTWLNFSSKSKNVIVSRQANEFMRILKNNVESSMYENIKNSSNRIVIKNHDFK